MERHLLQKSRIVTAGSIHAQGDCADEDEGHRPGCETKPGLPEALDCRNNPAEKNWKSAEDIGQTLQIDAQESDRAD
jgi:hypothetical protein